MKWLALAVLLAGPTPSPLPDATPTTRGVVNTGAQSFAGLKTFDGGVQANITGSSSLYGLPICSTLPMGPGATLSVTDAGTLCWLGGSAAFEFAPANGLGMGTACACTNPTGAAGEVLSITRSTVGECYSSNGQTLTQCAANQPRVMTGSATSNRLGLLVEKDATQNDVLQSRDVSQAVWTKTNMTCAHTATGMRNDTNGATTCTATAANATVCQTVTAAAAARASSWHLRRRTGSGAVTLSRDGSTYLANISAQLSSTLWRRAVPSESTGCAGGNCIVLSGLTSSIANPTLCLKLAVSGDAVDIDFVQDEVGTIATTPIATTTVSVPRGAETPYVTLTTPFVVRSLGVQFQVVGVPSSFYSPVSAYQDANNSMTLWSDSNPTMAIGSLVAGSLTTYTSLFFLPPGADTFAYWAGDLDGTNAYFTQQGVTSSTAGTNTGPTATRIYLGMSPVGGTKGMSGVIRGVCADPVVGRCRQLFWDVGGSPVAAIGDSITQGVNQIPTRWAQQLDLSQVRSVYTQGNTGISAAVCLQNYQNYVVGHGYTAVTVLCGVNSLIAGDSGASVFATLQQIYDDARTRGMKVKIGTILPWGAYASSTAPKQTETTNLNALIRNYCTTYAAQGVSCVDFWNSSLNDGSGNLAGAYDSGDHIHPNAAGGAYMATLWNSVFP